MNEHVLTRMNAITNSLMATWRAGHGMPSAMVGLERETFLRDFLQQVFPAHRRFATGCITDSRGSVTGQVDIAVEYGSAPSFPIPGGSQRLLLAESVACVIEVKSNLGSQWDEVTATVAKVRKLERGRTMHPVIQPGIRGPMGSYLRKRASAESGVIPCVAVGYEGPKTASTLAKRMESTSADECPDAALVIEHGTFSGFGVQATGAEGFYLLCCGISNCLLNIAMATPDLTAYAENPQMEAP